MRKISGSWHIAQIPQTIPGNLFKPVGGPVTFSVSNYLLIFLLSGNHTVLFNGTILTLGCIPSKHDRILGMIVVEMHFRVTFQLHLPRLPCFSDVIPEVWRLIPSQECCQFPGPLFGDYVTRQRARSRLWLPSGTLHSGYIGACEVWQAERSKIAACLFMLCETVVNVLCHKILVPLICSGVKVSTKINMHIFGSCGILYSIKISSFFCQSWVSHWSNPLEAEIEVIMVAIDKQGNCYAAQIVVNELVFKLLCSYRRED